MSSSSSNYGYNYTSSGSLDKRYNSSYPSESRSEGSTYSGGSSSYSSSSGSSSGSSGSSGAKGSASKGYSADLPSSTKYDSW